MAEFNVLYGPAQEAYESLKSRFTTLSNALDDLNAVLATVDSEVDGKAKPLWQDQQATWNGNYTEMATDLNVGAATVNQVTDIYDDGDLTAARIFN